MPAKIPLPTLVALVPMLVAFASPGAARGVRHDPFAPGIRLSSCFGSRIDPFLGTTQMHRGIDLAGPAGTPIVAAAAGIVDIAEPRGGYGNFVEITHPDGSRTRYGHMARLLVSAGTMVRQGDILGLMGSTGRSTGSHLHFEYLRRGVAVDPLRFLAAPSSGAPLPRIVAPRRLEPAIPFRSTFARARDSATIGGNGAMP